MTTKLKNAELIILMLLLSQKHFVYFVKNKFFGLYHGLASDESSTGNECSKASSDLHMNYGKSTRPLPPLKTGKKKAIVAFTILNF